MQAVKSVFNPVQLHILEMFNYCRSDESMEELRNVLSDFYAQKVQKEADRLWDSGELNGEAIEKSLMSIGLCPNIKKDDAQNCHRYQLSLGYPANAQPVSSGVDGFLRGTLRDLCVYRSPI